MQKEKSEPVEKIKIISIRVIIILIISAILLSVLVYLTNHVVLNNHIDFDNSVFLFISQYKTPATTDILTFFTFFGSINFLMPAYILLSLYFILFKKNNIRSFNIIAIGLSSGILLHLIKNIFQRNRPLHPLIENVRGFSFPSGHSFSSFTFVGLLIYMLWETNNSIFIKWLYTVILFVLAAIIAFSRIYLQVHYASDVIAGFCLSFIWLTICINILERINRKGMIIKKTN